jgi:hypothetical protein
MKEITSADLGPQQQAILKNSSILGAGFDSLPKLNRAAYFSITSALVLRAKLPIMGLRLKGGLGGIEVDRVFFEFDPAFIKKVEDATGKGKTFKSDGTKKHKGIQKAVRQATMFGSLQIGWSDKDEGKFEKQIEVDIDVGNPQKPLGLIVHTGELANNKFFGKIGKFLRIPGVRDHTDHDVLRKLLDARAV